MALRQTFENTDWSEEIALAHHHVVTKALFDTYGTPAYAPPRRAIVASNREHSDAKERG
ncbi:hypothetical protein GALL_458740 [mine drainage metagenome]|uniref:Uncharacterized protein n=1 Tax=mine drainage metagenome TaxID=410659 RepID=A0A1J5PLU6_9ZZZZ